MIIDFTTLSPGRAYRFLISAIVPRPIAFISSLSPEGVQNLAPFSYFMGVGSKPVTVAVAIHRRPAGHKDTGRNILETKEFVINVSSEAIAKQVTLSSGDYAGDVDEFAVTGLTPAPSQRVKPPRVLESPVNLECRLYRSVDIGEGPVNTSLIVGEVLLAHVRDELWDDAMIQADRLHPIARLGGNLYTTLGRVFAQDRPQVDERGKLVEPSD